jgi:CrcB protein
VTGGAWIAFLCAAAIGAPARYALDRFVQERTAGAFPWGTLVVNLTGCLGLGVLTGLGLYHDLSATTRTVAGSGGLGAYTTFSTFAFETVRLVEEGAANDALRNVAANIIVGVIAAGIGLAITSVL